MKKRIILVGNDSIGWAFLDILFNHFGDDFIRHNIVLKDKSSNLSRIFRLINSRRIKLNTLFKMFLAESLRKLHSPNSYDQQPCCISNSQLSDIIKCNIPIDEILLFRAGLIVSKGVLSLGVPIYNIHCAMIPSFGGLGSIEKALTRRSYNQAAVVHRITTRIDEGEIICSWPYKLNPQLTYKQNELIAYSAGFKAGIKFLSHEVDHIDLAISHT